MFKVLQATPHLPMNDERSNAPSAREGCFELGAWTRIVAGVGLKDSSAMTVSEVQASKVSSGEEEEPRACHVMVQVAVITCRDKEDIARRSSATSLLHPNDLEICLTLISSASAILYLR
jgi:hypothetical protein